MVQFCLLCADIHRCACAPVLPTIQLVVMVAGIAASICVTHSVSLLYSNYATIFFLSISCALLPFITVNETEFNQSTFLPLCSVHCRYEYTHCWLNIFSAAPDWCTSSNWIVFCLFVCLFWNNVSHNYHKSDGIWPAQQFNSMQMQSFIEFKERNLIRNASK